MLSERIRVYLTIYIIHLISTKTMKNTIFLRRFFEIITTNI